MNKILILIPMKPNLNDKLKVKLLSNVAAMSMVSGGEYEIVVDHDGTPDTDIPTVVTSPESRLDNLHARVTRNAAVRNRLIRSYLRRDHTHVVWIDADIVSFNPQLPRVLAQRSDAQDCDSITAPAVLLEDHHCRWYDTAGFLQRGKTWARPDMPWFKDMTNIHFKDGFMSGVSAMQSVGAFYCVPANLYRNGAQHVSIRGVTEHYSVCQTALARGMNVLCFFDNVVWHAYLPNYGEANH